MDAFVLRRKSRRFNESDSTAKLVSESEEKHPKAKLILITLPDNWPVLYHGNNNTSFIQPNLVDSAVSVDLCLEVNNYLFASEWFHVQSKPFC